MKREKSTGPIPQANGLQTPNHPNIPCQPYEQTNKPTEASGQVSFTAESKCSCTCAGAHVVAQHTSTHNPAQSSTNTLTGSSCKLSTMKSHRPTTPRKRALPCYPEVQCCSTSAAAYPRVCPPCSMLESAATHPRVRTHLLQSPSYSM